MVLKLEVTILNRYISEKVALNLTTFFYFSIPAWITELSYKCKKQRVFMKSL